MGELETSGVESAVESTPIVAESGNNVESTVASEGAGLPTTGEKDAPVAGEESATTDKTEIAFAKRLAAERQKIESEAIAKAQAMLREQDPALKFVNKIAKENGMSTDELVQYWQQEQERREIERLTSQGVPEELAVKLQRVNEYEQRLARYDADRQLQAKIDADLKEFMSAYPDLKPDEVPNEVWDLTKKGIPLLDAYNRVAFPKKLQELQQAQEVAKKNAENANKSPGSVTGQGAVPSDFISKSDFEANKGNRRWMIDNLSKVMASRSKWGG